MYSKTNLTSTLGELDFSVFYFPPWLKGLYAVLGSAAFVSNSVSLGYICKKLNLSNVVNFIPLLECLNNILGFGSMAIVSLLAYFDLTFETLTCYINLPILFTMFISSKYPFDGTLVWFQYDISIKLHRSCHLMLFVNHSVHHCEKRCRLGLRQMVEIIVCTNFAYGHSASCRIIMANWNLSYRDLSNQRKNTTFKFTYFV